MAKTNHRIAIVLGAGSTVADAKAKSATKRPPLDRGFFASSRNDDDKDLDVVRGYMRMNYGVDVTLPQYDSLERIMAVIYTDVFGGPLQSPAFKAFRSLVRAFLKRLASTTNSLPMSKKSQLYRVVSKQLNQIDPDALTIISFNQDMQMEKALDALSSAAKWKGKSVFAFPGCYRLGFKGKLTAPSKTGASVYAENKAFVGIELLKLHGSLSWYSAHNTPNPSKNALFKPSRVIGITRRKTIDTTLKLDKKLAPKARFTFQLSCRLFCTSLEFCTRIYSTSGTLPRIVCAKPKKRLSLDTLALRMTGRAPI